MKKLMSENRKNEFTYKINYNNYMYKTLKSDICYHRVYIT